MCVCGIESSQRQVVRARDAERKLVSGAAGAGAAGAGMKTETTTVSWIQEEKEEAAWTYCSRG